MYVLSLLTVFPLLRLFNYQETMSSIVESVQNPDDQVHAEKKTKTQCLIA